LPTDIASAITRRHDFDFLRLLLMPPMLLLLLSPIRYAMLLPLRYFISLISLA